MVISDLHHICTGIVLAPSEQSAMWPALTRPDQTGEEDD
jgi:hypothetical protein